MKRISVRRVGTVLLGIAAAVSLAPSSAQATFGLAGEWRLDDGSGLLAGDSSGASRTGQLGAGSSTPQWVQGIDGHALRFDGDDEVRMPDSAGLEPARITVEAWVRSEGSPGSFRYVVSKGATGCETSSYGLYTASSRGLAFYVNGPSGYVVSAQAPPAGVWDGAWHHAAGTFDGVTVRMHIDGAEVGSGRQGPSTIVYGLPSKNLLLGTYRGDCDLPFTGDIDAVRIWSLALTPAEIATAQAQPAAGPTPRPDDPRPGASAADLGTAFTAGQTAGGANGTGASPTAARCLKLVASKRRVRIGRRTTLTATVLDGARRAAGAGVVLTAKGMRRSVRRTDRWGRARFVVRPRFKTTLRLRTLVRPSCASPPVARVRAG